MPSEPFGITLSRTPISVIYVPVEGVWRAAINLTVKHSTILTPVTSNMQGEEAHARAVGPRMVPHPSGS